MTAAAWTVLGLGVSTYLLKAAGPILLGGRSLPPRLLSVAERLPAALLAALVVVTSMSEGSTLVLDARAVGLAAAAVALILRAPFLAVVFAAALTAAVVRHLA